MIIAITLLTILLAIVGIKIYTHRRLKEFDGVGCVHNDKTQGKGIYLDIGGQ